MNGPFIIYWLPLITPDEVSPICFLDTSEVETMNIDQIMLVSSL